MGCKPYFREYTTDWEYAKEKMKRSWFQRHLVHESYNKGIPWDGYAAVSQKPHNSAREPEFTNLSGVPDFDASEAQWAAATNGANGAGTSTGSEAWKQNGELTKRL